MTALRYRSDALRGDYIRAAIGAGLCGAVLVVAWDTSAVRWIFAPLTAFFLVFAARTGLRHLMEFRLTAGGIQRSIAPVGAQAGGFTRSLSWANLRRVRLRYYSTRRDRSDGWMHLVMHGDEGRLSLDSTVEDFGRIARAAAQAAVDRRLDLSPATRSNFAALDIRIDRLEQDRDRADRQDSSHDDRRDPA